MNKIALFGIAVLALGVTASYATAELTSDQQDKWKNVKESMKSGDYESWKAAVNAITEEDFTALQEHRANHPRMHKHMHAAMHEAVENNDFAAWQQAIEDSGKTPPFEVNEQTFNAMVEIHQAMKDGHFEKARELKNDLGLPMKGRGHFKHHGQSLDLEPA